MNEVIWPKGYVAERHKIALNAKAIREGTLLAIDPSSGGSSLPGYAIFHAGILVVSGVIEFPKKKQDIYQRLQYLYDKVNALSPVPPDVLAIEQIHKAMAGKELVWAAGTSIAAARSPITIEVPLNIWKAVAKATPTYVKDDESDARMIGTCVVMLAQGRNQI